MVNLLEEVVDRAADRLERVAENVANASHAIFYEPAELETIVHRAARVLKMEMAKDGGAEIAKRSRTA